MSLFSSLALQGNCQYEPWHYFYFLILGNFFKHFFKYLLVSFELALPRGSLYLDSCAFSIFPISLIFSAFSNSLSFPLSGIGIPTTLSSACYLFLCEVHPVLLSRYCILFFNDCIFHTECFCLFSDIFSFCFRLLM